MTMPNMTGDRLAMEMRRIRPDIPILLCTGYSEAQQKQTARAIGIRGIVMKPVLMYKLATAVREALEDREAQADTGRTAPPKPPGG
jgi:CheY-like chemotaxis protein